MTIPHIEPLMSYIGPKSCPGGWQLYEGHCYYIPQVAAMTYNDAKEVCDRLGGAKVVSINTAEEETFVEDA